MTLDEATLNSARRVIRRANFRLKAEENEAAFSLFEKALEYIPKSVEIMNVLGALTITDRPRDDSGATLSVISFLTVSIMIFVIRGFGTLSKQDDLKGVLRFLFEPVKREVE